MRGESFQFLTRCNFSINTPLPSLKKTSPFAATPVPTLELLPATYVQTSFPVLLFNAESVPPESMSTPPVSVAALDVIALLATSLGLATAYHCLNCLGPSLFSDRHASLSRASWPFFPAFPPFLPSSPFLALHPAVSATSHAQGLPFCTAFVHQLRIVSYSVLFGQSQVARNRHRDMT